MAGSAAVSLRESDEIAPARALPAADLLISVISPFSSLPPACHNSRKDTFDGCEFHRFRQVEVKPGLPRPALVVIAPPTGEGDEYGPAERRLGAQAHRNLVTVHPGKPDVQEHHLGIEGAGRVQGRRATITPARKFRMLLHINPTRQRGKRTGSLARASGWYMTFFAAGVI